MGIMDLLKKLADGVFDGERTDSEINGVSSGFYIDKGTPVKYRQGKSTKFFDGKENIRTRGKRTEERFETNKEKTGFFKKYGFSQVDKSELPLKIWGDCLLCVKFPDCDETAMMKDIA